MKPGDKTEPEVTDVGTLLHSLASRLRLLAAAIRGVAADRSDTAETVEGRIATEMAGDLEEISRRLDLVIKHLCQKCQLAEVVEVVTIARTEEVGPKPPPQKRRRRRKP